MVKPALKWALRAFALEQPARRVQAALRPAYVKRNQRDDDHLRLLLALALPADASCIDVGANIGTILDAIVVNCPGGRHLAFEPLPELADELAARYPGVVVRREALSDCDGTAEFSRNETAPSQSGLAVTMPPRRAGKKSTFQVKLARLDDLLPKDHKPAFVKIDVEGHELQVLRGARRTLAEAQPIVAIEHGHGPAQPDIEHARAVFAELDGAGLRIFDMDGRYLPEDAFVEVYVSGERWNFLAHR